jgi:hypothetical protein
VQRTLLASDVSAVCTAVTLGCLLVEAIKRGFVDQLKKDSFLVTHWNLEDWQYMDFTFSLAFGGDQGSVVY